MQKLNQTQKQQIKGGAIPGATIHLLHGLIQAIWVTLDVFNMASDYMPKKTKPIPVSETPVMIHNDLINDRNTIFS